jgi:hypothetical protein
MVAVMAVAMELLQLAALLATVATLVTTVLLPKAAMPEPLTATEAPKPKATAVMRTRTRHPKHR